MTDTYVEGRAAVKKAAVAASGQVPRRVRSKATAKKQLTSLASFDDLPEFLKDNEFIKGSYRTEATMRDTWWTLFKFHNETGNVWTHLFGFMLFLCLTAYLVAAPPAPLAFGRHQLEGLLANMQGSMEHASEAVQQNIHTLQDTLHIRMANLQTQLQHMQGNLQHGVHALQDSVTHSMTDNFQGVRDSVRGSLHEVQHGLAGILDALRTRTLGDNLHHLSDSAVHSLKENMSALKDGLMLLGERGESAALALGEQLQHLAEALTPQRVQSLLAMMRRSARQQLQEMMKPTLRWPSARWPMYVYTAGAMICLLTSSFCHLFGCCSKHVAQMLWRFDYSGIAVLILSSFFPPIYYGFMCEPLWKNVYLISTSVLGVAVVAVSLLDRFQSIEYRRFRALLFLTFGMWGVVPLLHLLATQAHIWHVRNAIILDAIMGLVYVVGAIVYATRIPERWLPGAFDMALHSHQIFHLAVVLGAYVHFRAVVMLLEWRDASGGCAAPINGPLGNVLEELSARGGGLSMDQVMEAVHSTLGI